MGIVIAQEFLSRRYEARRWSLAAVFHFSCYVALVILPFITAYNSRSLWLNEKTGREQPEVHFQHEVLVLAQGSNPSEQFSFSTSPSVNALFGDDMRAMSIRTSEQDVNNDGRPELLHVEISIPLREGEEISGITVLVGLEYSLQDTARFTTNATAIVHHSAGSSGSSLQYYGDLELRQHRALPSISEGTNGPSVLLGVSLATSAAQLAPAALIGRYMAYSDAVHLAPRYPVWVPGAGLRKFTASITMAARPTLVQFQPGIAETLKFAWVQYISFFIPLWYLLRQLKYFAAYFQITPCRVVVDRPQVRKINDHDF